MIYLFYIFPVIFYCYAASRDEKKMRNISRLVMLAVPVFLSLLLVPSGFSFMEAVEFWLRWWNLILLFPAVLFFISGIFLLWMDKRWAFLTGIFLFSLGLVFRSYNFPDIFEFKSPLFICIVGGVYLAVILVLYFCLGKRTGFSGLVLLFSGLLAGAECTFETVYWLKIGTPVYLLDTILFIAAGFLRSRSVLNESLATRKHEILVAVIFSLAQVLSLLAWCIPYGV